MNTLIKICGIQCPKQAFVIARLGADFIGIMQSHHSKRYVPIHIAKEIAEASREGGAKVVLVVTDISSGSLDHIVSETRPDFVQCYQRDFLLSESIGKILVNHNMDKIRKGKDFFMMDHPIGGQGIPLNWEELSAPKGVVWFLAGGLAHHNVQEALRILNPSGVDVSTGVETDGKKDIDKIKIFIEKVRSYA